MNARLISTAADLICRSMKAKQTPAGIAADLDAAGMLQSPESAAEVERLRARVAELEPTSARRLIAWRRARTRARATAGAADRYAGQAAELQTALQDTLTALLTGQAERNGLRARVAELDQQAAAARAVHSKYPDSEHCEHDGEAWPCPTLRAIAGDGDPESPWQRAVDGLNALATAGIGFHIEPDGHISNPAGDEHIEWDRAAERWRLVHDDDPAPTAAASVATLRGVLAPSAPPEPHSCGVCGIPQRGHGIQFTAYGHHQWKAPTNEQVEAREQECRAAARAAGGERP